MPSMAAACDKFLALEPPMKTTFSTLPFLMAWYMAGASYMIPIITFQVCREKDGAVQVDYTPLPPIWVVHDQIDQTFAGSRQGETKDAA